MTTRRDAISFGVSSLLLGSLPDGADRRLLALVEEHRRFDEAIQVAEDQADALIIADRRARRTRSAATEAACGRAEALHEAQGGVANAIINTPASTLVGAAYKLIVWRREAAISFPDDFDGAHESFTFSAYRDLLRLTGLEALAHPNDPATLARMRKYWIPS
jgi:hypothetical protein